MKKCRKCNSIKRLNDFSRQKTNRDGRHSVCKSCRNIYYNKNKDIWRERAYVLKYDINLETYHKMYYDSFGSCNICFTHKDVYTLVVDHCHITGKVRGLLCDLCNRGIGLLKDSKKVLVSATKYLEEHE